MFTKKKIGVILFIFVLVSFLYTQIGIVNQYIENTVIGYIETFIGSEVTYTFKVSEPGKTIISLNWEDVGGILWRSHLNIAVFDQSGKCIAEDRKFVQPKIMIVDTSTIGDYTVQIRSYMGKTNYKLDIIKPGDAIIATENDAFGRDSLWEIDTRELDQNELQILWSEIANKHTNLEVEIYSEDMVLYNKYRIGISLTSFELLDLPEGKYIMRLRKLVPGNLKLILSDAFRPIKVEEKFFSNVIQSGSTHRYRVNITGNLSLDQEYYWLIWNNIYENQTPMLEMKLLRLDEDGSEEEVKLAEEISSGQSILKLSEVTPGEYILQIKALDSGDEPARYAIAQLEEMLKPIEYQSFTIKRTLDSSISEITHTIIPQESGNFEVNISARDMNLEDNSTYTVQVYHQDNAEAIIDESNIITHDPYICSIDAERLEVYTLKISTSNGNLEYEVGMTPEIGDEAIVEYYFQKFDNYINFAELDDDMALEATNVISTYGEENEIQEYLAAAGYTADELNQYDREILAWTNYWNDRAEDFTNRRLLANRGWGFQSLPSNFVKAIMFQESKMGNYEGRGNGIDNPMQILRDTGVYVLARTNPGGDWGIPTEGIPIARMYIENGRTNPTPRLSIALGVRWLLWKYNLRNGDIWEAAREYNSNDKSEQVYDDSGVLQTLEHEEIYATSVETLYTTGKYTCVENLAWITPITIFEP